MTREELSIIKELLRRSISNTTKNATDYTDKRSKINHTYDQKVLEDRLKELANRDFYEVLADISKEEASRNLQQVPTDGEYTHRIEVYDQKYNGETSKHYRTIVQKFNPNFNDTTITNFPSNAPTTEAVKKYVDEISKNSNSDWKGTFHVKDDFGLDIDETDFLTNISSIEDVLNARGISATENDYVYVAIPQTSHKNSIYKTDPSYVHTISKYCRFKWTVTYKDAAHTIIDTQKWVYNFYIDVASLTDPQWKAVNSFMTVELNDELRTVKSFDTNHPEAGGIRQIVSKVTWGYDDTTEASKVDGKLDVLMTDVQTSIDLTAGPTNTNTHNNIPSAKSVWDAIDTLDYKPRQATVDSTTGLIDVSAAATDGKYVLEVKEENGKITEVIKDFITDLQPKKSDGTVNPNQSDNTNAPTAKAVADLVNSLDYTPANRTTTVAADGYYTNEVTESNGIISRTISKFDTTIDTNVGTGTTNTDNNAPTTKAIGTFVKAKIDELDVAEVGADGKYIKKIKEENGLISTTLQTFDTTLGTTSTDNNTPSSKAVVTFVNSSIATATAEFKGTVTAKSTQTEADWLNLVKTTFTTADENDYAFVDVRYVDDKGAITNNSAAFRRYKYTTKDNWKYEYTLNNSSFTVAQWAAINSGITEKRLDDVEKHNNISAAEWTTISTNFSSLLES